MDAHRGYRIRLQIAGSSMHNNTMSPRCHPAWVHRASSAQPRRIHRASFAQPHRIHRVSQRCLHIFSCSPLPTGRTGKPGGTSRLQNHHLLMIGLSLPKTSASYLLANHPKAFSALRLFHLYRSPIGYSRDSSSETFSHLGGDEAHRRSLDSNLFRRRATAPPTPLLYTPFGTCCMSRDRCAYMGEPSEWVHTPYRWVIGRNPRWLVC